MVSPREIRSESLPTLTSLPFDPGKVSNFVKEALASSSRLGFLSKELGDMTVLREVLDLAFQENDTQRGVQAALQWADNFVWSDEVFRADRERFIRNNKSLTSMARDLFVESSAFRMNAERVERSRRLDSTPEHHDWELLKHMASYGVSIPVSESFCPRTSPRPLRKSYTDVAPAVNKSMVELQGKGSIFLLKMQDIDEAFERDEIHFSDMHWVVKVDADKGRPIADVSAGSEGEDTLNSEDIKERGIERYGELFHPTVLTFATMVEGQRSRYRQEIENGERLMLWKSDIDSAFMQMRIAPDSVKLVLFPLTDGVVMGYVTGFFGWTSFPQCFDVITRRIRSISKHLLKGDSTGYVDDFGGACLERDVSNVITTFYDVVEGLLGPGSVNAKKTIWGRKIVFIGWEFDLDGGPSISLSDRNLRKVLHGIFSIPSNWTLRRSHIERLGSWASRYFAVVFPQLRPFASLLFREIHGLDRDVLKELSEASRFVILIWRAFMCMLVSRPLVYRRQLYQLIPCAPSIYVSFDASLTGIGIRMFSFVDERVGHCIKVIWIQFDPMLYNFTSSLDSSFQNASEFLAVTVSLAYLVFIGIRDAAVRLQGDSVTALTWASTRAFKPGRSFRSACLQMQIALRANITVDGTTDHIRGVLNYDNDLISRNGDNGKNGVPVDILCRYPVDLLVTRQSWEWLDWLLVICNPEAPAESASDMEAFWCELENFVAFLISQASSPMLSSEFISATPGSAQSLQLFISAPIANRPPYSNVKRPAWTCILPLSASVGELIEAVALEYRIEPAKLKLRIARLNIILVYSGLARSLVNDLGLVNADAVELLGSLRGGMKRVRPESEINRWNLEALACLNSAHLRNNQKQSFLPIDDASCVGKRLASVDEYPSWALSARLLLDQYVHVNSSTSNDNHGSLISPVDLANLKRIRGISAGTKEGYKQAWPFWLAYLESRNQLQITFLSDLSLRVSRVIVANFVVWLAEVKLKSESQIKTIFSGLRNAFLSAGEDVTIFADPLISYAKRAFAEEPRDTSIRRLQGVNGKLRLPACFEFLRVLRDWALSSHSIDGQYRLMVYLASVTMYNFGLRFCNAGYDSKVKGKHAVRRRDVVFEDTSDRRFSIPQYHDFLVAEGIWGDREAVRTRIKCLVLFFHSSKVRKKVGRVEVLGRRSSYESQFLEDLSLWLLFDSGLSCSLISVTTQPSFNGDDLVFSRSHCKTYKRKGPTWLIARLLRSDVSQGAKMAAVTLNLDPVYFSSHCYKIAAITDMSSEGESAEVVRRLGDHAAGSASTFLYQHSSGREMRPLLLASAERGLSVRDIRTICPIREHLISAVASPELLASLAEIEDNPCYTPVTFTSLTELSDLVWSDDLAELSY